MSTFSVRTLAGRSSNGFGDGKGDQALFNYPRGVCIDNHGNIFVADSYNHKIRVIKPDGTVSTLAGGSTNGFCDGKGADALFSFPSGICVDNDGNIIVADSNNHSIRVIKPDGTVSTLAGGSKGFRDGKGADVLFNSPRGVCIDNDGNIFVADSSNRKIRVIKPDGTVSTLAGGSSKGSRDGKGADALFNCPSGVCLDNDGNIIVVDSNNHNIRVIAPDGTVSTLAVGSSKGFRDGDFADALFNCPSVICIDKSSNNILVADTNNHKIRVIKTDGTVSTLAGGSFKVSTQAGGSTNGFCDGKGADALFSFPSGICVDNDGNIIVADSNNHRIRVIKPDDTVSALSHGNNISNIATTTMSSSPRADVKNISKNTTSTTTKTISSPSKQNHDSSQSILSIARARVDALSKNLERIDFARYVANVCTVSVISTALAISEAPARFSILKTEANTAFLQWQERAKFVESLVVSDKVSANDVVKAIHDRHVSANDALRKLSSARICAATTLDIDGDTAIEMIKSASDGLNLLVQGYLKLYGTESVRNARFFGTVASALQTLQDTAQSDHINSLDLERSLFTTIESTANTSSNLPNRVSALDSLIALARDALAIPTQTLSITEKRFLVLQDEVCLARQLETISVSQKLAEKCARAYKVWPSTEEAEKTAKKRHIEAKRVIEDAEADGEAPTKESVDRLTNRLQKKTEAVIASEALRTQMRLLVTDGCPEARFFLSSMIPRILSPTFATEFDKMWADLLEIGVASTFRRDDFTDLQALPHSSGRVFRARLHNTEERTVLKEFSNEPGATDLKLFMNEVRLLQKLRHPNILALHSVLRDSNSNRVYLRLPWVEGGSLREWLSETHSPLECVRTFAGVASALAYIHASGVVHRDLKPENILMGGDGIPRLCDFGISLSTAMSHTTMLDAAGAGTEEYKSPEVLRGEKATSMSDQYALGLVLHELVFRAPYKATIKERREANVNKDVLLLKNIPSEWPNPLSDAAILLIKRLLSSSPYDRPTANNVLADPFCERAADLSASISDNDNSPNKNDAVIHVRRDLSSKITKAPKRPSVLLPHDNDTLFSIFTTAMHASCAESNDASSWRLCLSLESGGDIERALDLVLATAMQSKRGLFVTASDEGAGPVLPAVPRSGEIAGLHADGLFAVGAALAQAAVQGCFELDALCRIPEIAFFSIAYGPDELIRKHFSTLSRALAALEQFDSDKAGQFRTLLQGSASDYNDLEVKGWLGTPQVVTDANKADLVRRECEEIIVRRRWDAWIHLRKGWIAGCGNVVVEVCEKRGLESIRLLVYDPEATQRRRAEVAASVNLGKDQRAALGIKLCPHCGFPVAKIDGCDSMVCGRDYHGSALFNGGCGKGFSWNAAQH
jgi:serine/threonine protein kinase/sugar lactone lactonase YvrE